MKVSSCKKTQKAGGLISITFELLLLEIQSFCPIPNVAEKVETMGVLEFGPGLPLADKCL